MVAVRSIGVALGLALLGGCGAPTAPERHLVTHVALDRASLAPGDTLRVTVTITNTAPFTVTVHGSSSCLISMAVYRDATGELAYPRGQACTADLRALRVGPGRSHSRTLVWTAERHEYLDAELRKVPEPPGHYRVVGGLGYTIHLRQPSAPAWVEVLPPDP